MHHQNPELQACIENCEDCSRECQETLFGYCLPKGGQHIEAHHVKLMADCIEICQTSANFMKRNSEYHEVVCNACAELCEACAKSCEAMNDETMKRCAEVCRRCAKTCRDMGRAKKAA